MGEVGDALVAPRVVPGAGEDPQLWWRTRETIREPRRLSSFLLSLCKIIRTSALCPLSALSRNLADGPVTTRRALSYLWAIFLVFTTPHSGCRASCGTAMPAEMPAVRVAHHRAVLLEHPSQLELKFGGSGAVARPRPCAF